MSSRTRRSKRRRQEGGEASESSRSGANAGPRLISPPRKRTRPKSLNSAFAGGEDELANTDGGGRGGGGNDVSDGSGGAGGGGGGADGESGGGGSLETKGNGGAKPALTAATRKSAPSPGATLLFEAINYHEGLVEAVSAAAAEAPESSKWRLARPGGSYYP